MYRLPVLSQNRKTWPVESWVHRQAFRGPGLCCESNSANPLFILASAENQCPTELACANIDFWAPWKTCKQSSEGCAGNVECKRKQSLHLSSEVIMALAKSYGFLIWYLGSFLLVTSKKRKSDSLLEKRYLMVFAFVNHFRKSQFTLSTTDANKNNTSRYRFLVGLEIWSGSELRIRAFRWVHVVLSLTTCIVWVNRTVRIR